MRSTHVLDSPRNHRDLRRELEAIAPRERDAWLDALLGIDELPDDDPSLPRGCVPYLPCPVDAIVRFAEAAGIVDSDVIVDVGCGVGRAAAALHLLTGASVLGIEIQPKLARAAESLFARLELPGCEAIALDAANARVVLSRGSAFFLYCPFGGSRLERFVDDLEPIAAERAIRIGCVDLPLPPRAWLTARSSCGDLEVYHAGPTGRA